MTQITFKGRIAAVVAAGAGLTTTSVHVLPSWAPPINYIGTTTPWLATMLVPTTTTGIVGIKQVKVRSYGSEATLHGGAQCITTNRAIVAGREPIIILTYEAVGELTRPE